MVASDGCELLQDCSLGITLAGLLFSAVLFGVTNIQTVNYYQDSGRDPTPLKWMIAFLWSLGILQFVMESYYVYVLVAANNSLQAIEITWTWGIFVIAGTIGDCIIRLYNTWRIWIMSEINIILVAAITGLNFIIFVVSLALAVKLLMFTAVSQIKAVSVLMYIGLGSSVVGDSLTAISLCFFLRRTKSEFQRTRSLVNTLTIYVVNTRILTSLWAIACLVLFALMPNSLAFAAVYVCLSKLYFNALLATLNTRRRLRGSLSKDDYSKMDVTSCRMPATLRGSQATLTTPKHAPSGSFSINVSSIEEDRTRVTAMNRGSTRGYHTVSVA